MLNDVRIEHGDEDEAEKPFWISYADLMTALMVLFLVVMLASLVSLTRTVTDLQDTRTRSEELADKYKALQARNAAVAEKRDVYEKDVDKFWTRLDRSTKGLGVTIDRTNDVIAFGSKARFATGSDRLGERGELVLRRFAPRLVALADSRLGRRVFRQAVVEGYADRRGDYLLNLNLSLNRSQRVLCALLAGGGQAELAPGLKRRVRDLFLVGGYSFNGARRSLAASRRVEMKLQFLGPVGKRSKPPVSRTSFGKCSLGA